MKRGSSRRANINTLSRKPQRRPSPTPNHSAYSKFKFKKR